MQLGWLAINVFLLNPAYRLKRNFIAYFYENVIGLKILCSVVLSAILSCLGSQTIND